MFNVLNKGAFQQELVSLNGEKFIGTVTHREAKHEIYRKFLEFIDCSNFDRVRLEYRVVPMVVFILKTAIFLMN
jgi:hypothetical protein